MSLRAEAEFDAWRGSLGEGRVQSHRIDVLSQRALARGLTAELGIDHESPQALVFTDGELSAHASHADLVQAWFRQKTGC